MNIGSVIAFHKSFLNTPALDSSWVECNGQTLNDTESPFHNQIIPNLNNDRYLRGSTTSGSTGGGSGAHTHSVINVKENLGQFFLPVNYSIISTTSNGPDLNPPHMRVVWIIKIK